MQTEDVGRRGRDHDQVARADPSSPDRLRNRGHPADRDGGEHRPRKVRLARTRRPHHDHRDQDDGGKGEHGDLKAETDGERRRRPLVRLVPQSPAAVGPAGIHEELPEQRNDARRRAPTGHTRASDTPAVVAGFGVSLQGLTRDRPGRPAASSGNVRRAGIDSARGQVPSRSPRAGARRLVSAPSYGTSRPQPTRWPALLSRTRAQSHPRC